MTYAAMNNQQLEGAWHRWKAAMARIPQARALDDPRFSYSYYFQEVETRVGPQRQSFTLAQTIPWVGKVLRRGDAASDAARAAMFRFEAEKLALYARVTKAYADYYYLGQAIAVTRDNLALLTQLEELIRIRYQTTETTHAELLRIQIDISKLRDRQAALLEMAPARLASLNAELGRTAREPVGMPAAMDHVALDTTYERLFELMTANSPTLSALDGDVAQAEHKVQLAKLAYVPDVTLGATYIDTGSATAGSPSDSGKDAVIGIVSVNLPIWLAKLQAGVDEAQHEQAAAVARRSQTTRDLAARLQAALFELQDAQRRIDLYQQTLLPKAGEAMRVTQKAFSAGTASFNDLIDTQRVLLEFRLQHVRSLTDYAIQRSAVEQLVGTRLGFELEHPTSQPVE